MNLECSMWNSNCSSTQSWKHRQSQITQSLLDCVKNFGLYPKIDERPLKVFKEGSDPTRFALHKSTWAAWGGRHGENSKKGHLGSSYGSPGEKWRGPELRGSSEKKVKRTDLRYLEGRMDKNWLSGMKEERKREVKQWLPGYWLGQPGIWILSRTDFLALLVAAMASNREWARGGGAVVSAALVC